MLAAAPAAAQNVGINGAGCAFATVEAALAAASTNDVIHVSPGVYDENELFVTGEFITIQGSNGSCNGSTVGMVTIQPDQSSHRTFTVANGGLVLIGVIARGGSGPTGSVVFLDQFSTLAVSNSEIRDGISANDGGCIFASQSTVTLLSGAEVHNCDATDDGGAVALSVESTMHVFAGASLYLNEAQTGDGGAVSVEASNLIMKGEIRDNVAADSGGGVQLVFANGLDSSATFSDDASVHDNTADRGGGVYVGGSDTVLSMHDDASIEDNAATDGGGIYAEFGAGLHLNDDARVSGNVAERNGGGIFAFFTDDFDWDGASRVVIDDNTAGAEGGGAYLDGVILVASEVEISDNVAGTQGGGLRIVGYEPGFPNPVTDILLENALIKRNEAASGGGIHIANGLLTMGAVFTSCTPAALGFSNFCSELSNNAATDVNGVGGGVRAIGGAEVVIEETLFGGNSAGSAGGALAASGTTTSVTLRNDLVRNSTSGSGTAVQSTNAQLVVGASTFAANVVPLFWGASATGELDRSIVWANTNDSTLNASIAGSCNITQTLAGAPSGISNVQVNPLFAGPADARSRYRLSAGSPAINACAIGPSHDIDGVPRAALGTAYDRGAFEF